MTRPLDALAEALYLAHREWWFKKTGRELRHDAVLDKESVELNYFRGLTRACLRAIGEGKVVTREKIVKALSDKYGRLPDGSPYPSVLEMADALLALFREAGE